MQVFNCSAIAIIKSLMVCKVLAEVRVEFEVAFENVSAGTTWYSCQCLNNKSEPLLQT